MKKYFPAKDKTQNELVFMIPNYGGNSKTLLRHIKLYNSLGYDVLFYSPPFNNLHSSFLAITFFLHPFRLIYLWAYFIKKNLLKMKRKIIIASFSSPSSATLVALNRLPESYIKAWITDGGPFINLSECTRNSYIHHFKIKNELALNIGTFYGGIILGKKFEKEAQALVSSLPQNFPVLSITAEKDRVVPSRYTEEVFTNAKQLNMTSVKIKEADHLLGLRTHPEVYRNEIKGFLQQLKSK